MLLFSILFVFSTSCVSGQTFVWRVYSDRSCNSQSVLQSAPFTVNECVASPAAAGGIGQYSRISGYAPDVGATVQLWPESFGGCIGPAQSQYVVRENSCVSGAGTPSFPGSVQLTVTSTIAVQTTSPMTLPPISPVLVTYSDSSCRQRFSSIRIFGFTCIVNAPLPPPFSSSSFRVVPPFTQLLIFNNSACSGASTAIAIPPNTCAAAGPSSFYMNWTSDGGVTTVSSSSGGTSSPGNTFSCKQCQERCMFCVGQTQNASCTPCITCWQPCYLNSTFIILCVVFGYWYICCCIALCMFCCTPCFACSRSFRREDRLVTVITTTWGLGFVLWGLDIASMLFSLRKNLIFHVLRV